MTIQWGPAVSDASNAFRVGVEFVQTPAEVTAGTGSVIVTPRVYLQTKYNAFDSGADWSLTGSLTASGSAPFTHSSGTAWSTSNITMLAARDRTVTPSYSGAVVTSVTASVTGLTAIAGTASVSASWSTAKRPLSPPAAPASATITRFSDSQQNLTWVNTNPGSVSAPVQNLEIERWSITTGTYARIATTGLTSSYQDKTTVPNMRYRYRVRARNSGGVSGYTYTDMVITTPAAPSNVTAVKGATAITVSWKNNARYGEQIEVWHASNGVWDSTRLALLAGTVTTYQHASPDPAVTHAYRLRTVSTQPQLFSAYSTSSNTVQLLAPPFAPTGLAPNAKVADGSEPIDLSWVHNPADTSAQTKFEVQHRLVGAATWTSSGQVASSSSAWTIPAGTYTNPGTVEWQVRTWGQHASPSPWSATAAVTLSARPTALVNSPDGTIPVSTSTLTVTWGYNDPEASPQAQWKATLYDSAGAPLESLTGVGGTTSTTFATRVADGGSYTVGVTVQDGAGLWSDEGTQPFTVAYALPAAPVVTVEWMPDAAAAAVSVANPPPVVGQVDAMSVQVWRSVNGADWSLIAQDVSPDSSITDFIPALGVVNWYKAVAVSGLPSVAESVAVQVVTGGVLMAIVNAGPGFSESVQIDHTPRVGITGGREKVLRRFAGRTLPVEFTGEQRGRVLSLSAKLSPASPTTTEDVQWLADLPAPACYRDPTGRRIFVSMGDPSVSGEGETVRDLSWTLTEIDWAEPTQQVVT